MRSASRALRSMLGTINRRRMQVYRFVTTLLVGAALALPVLAQDEGVPPVLVDHWKTSKKYLLALAEQMPAADYGFKPNPAEMSFGEQMAHIAGSNSYFFATLSGQKDPLGKPVNFEKATVIKMLNDSYDFVISAMGTIKHDTMMKTFDGEGGKMTGMEMMLLA